MSLVIMCKGGAMKPYQRIIRLRSGTSPEQVEAMLCGLPGVSLALKGAYGLLQADSIRGLEWALSALKETID